MLINEIRLRLWRPRWWRWWCSVNRDPKLQDDCVLPNSFLSLQDFCWLICVVRESTWLEETWRMAYVSPINLIGFISTEKCSLSSDRDNLLSNFNGFQLKRFEQHKRKRYLSTNVHATVAKAEMDFTNTDWKQHFQKDFEERFSLPHLRDLFDINPRPTTFSLNGRWPHFYDARLPFDLLLLLRHI